VADPIRVLIVDDHVMVAQGLQRLMDLDPRLLVSGCATTLREARSLSVQLKPQVIVLDRRMPEGNAVPFTQELRDLAGGAKVIVLTGSGPGYRQEALDFGADLFLSKEAASDVIVEAIVRLVSWEDRVPQAVLTEREQDVARLLSSGSSNKEIADTLGISLNTVKTHLKHIVTQLDVRDRVGVALAWRGR